MWVADHCDKEGNIQETFYFLFEWAWQHTVIRLIEDTPF